MRRALVVFLATGLLVLAGIAWAYRQISRFPDRPAGSAGRLIEVDVRRGASFKAISKELERQGVLRSASLFSWYGSYTGRSANVKAGRYRLPSDITPRRLLDVLAKGVPAPELRVVIPEGKNMLEVAEILVAAKISDRKSLLAAMRDGAFLLRLGVPLPRLAAVAPTIEGFLFPDTYRIKKGATAHEVLAAMWQRHRAVYYQLAHKYPARLAQLRKSLRWGHFEIATMASIVEKETGQKHERPLIAGLFLNRLLLGHFQPKLLQTDPTIVYGCTVPIGRSRACETFSERIRRIHLTDKENLYNTYTHEGLPPGPISNPGRAALEAVFAPKRSRYLYFVSRNDGTHYFSVTRSQHERAVDYYQRGRGAPPPPQN